MAAVTAVLSERDRRLLFEVAFEATPEGKWEEAESCLDVLRLRKVEEELADVQRQLESGPAARAPGDNGEMRRLLQRKLELQLRRRLAEPAR